jgi:hypothetical protein
MGLRPPSKGTKRCAPHATSARRIASRLPPLLCSLALLRKRKRKRQAQPHACQLGVHLRSDLREHRRAVQRVPVPRGDLRRDLRRSESRSAGLRRPLRQLSGVRRRRHVRSLRGRRTGHSHHDSPVRVGSAGGPPLQRSPRRRYGVRAAARQHVMRHHRPRRHRPCVLRRRACRLHLPLPQCHRHRHVLLPVVSSAAVSAQGENASPTRRIRGTRRPCTPMRRVPLTRDS